MSRVNGRGADRWPVASGTTEESNSAVAQPGTGFACKLPVDLITHDRQRRAPYAGPIGCRYPPNWD